MEKDFQILSKLKKLSDSSTKRNELKKILSVSQLIDIIQRVAKLF